LKSCKTIASAPEVSPSVAGPVPGLVPPFTALCRAEPVADGAQYARCLVNVSISCGYRINPFGVNHFCLHPHHKEIIARTAGQ